MKSVDKEMMKLSDIMLDLSTDEEEKKACKKKKIKKWKRVFHLIYIFCIRMNLYIFSPVTVCDLFKSAFFYLGGFNVW